MDHITECPKCHAQLQVRLSFASGPRSEAKSQPSSKLQELLNQINDDDDIATQCLLALWAIVADYPYEDYECAAVGKAAVAHAKEL